MEVTPMSMNSVITNAGALVALESLDATNSQLTTTQNRISTGLKVASATDNGATWAVAQNIRSTVGALGAVTDSLNRGISVADVAVSAGQTISDLLNQMKAKALAATDTSATSSDITNYANDFNALRNQIAKIVSTSDFNGVNMIKTGGSSVMALASASGSVKVTVAAVSFALGGTSITVTAAATFTTQTTAAAVLALVNTSITNVNAAVAKLGTGVNALNSQLSFVQTQSDTLTTGIGNLVDADVAKESANLTALQTKQQLGAQALSIANSSSSILLSLFHG
jgi:flagellin